MEARVHHDKGQKFQFSLTIGFLVNTGGRDATMGQLNYDLITPSPFLHFRVGTVLGALDVTNVLVSCSGGLLLLADKWVEPLCGGLLATICVLRLSPWLLWRWKVVKQHRAVKALGDQKTREQPTIQSSFGGLSIGRQYHNTGMSLLFQLISTARANRVYIHCTVV